MIRSLRRKFILVAMLSVSLVFGIAFGLFCAYSLQTIGAESQRALQFALNRTDFFHEPSFEVGRAPSGPWSEFRVLSRNWPLFLLRVTADGRVAILSNGQVNISQSDIQTIVRLSTQESRDTGILPRYQLRYLRSSSGGETRIAFLDLSREKAVIREIVLSFGLFSLIGLTVFFLASLFLSKWALRPVERSWNQQRQLVGDASHELKTPLTVILANIGILKAHQEDTIAVQSKWLENTEMEAKRMRKLIDDLLFLAKMDDERTQPIRTPVDLSELVQGALLAFESVAFEREVTLVSDVISNVQVMGDERQLAQLVDILLDNAVKYAPPGEAVTLRMGLRHSKAEVTVHNPGPPVPAEELSHIFDRFYRSDVSRSQEGFGLGLSIAQSIARRHEGDITVESDAESGTTFRVTLPTGGG